MEYRCGRGGKKVVLYVAYCISFRFFSGLQVITILSLDCTYRSDTFNITHAFSILVLSRIFFSSRRRSSFQRAMRGRVHNPKISPDGGFGVGLILSTE
ncbi:hypothetical protein M426DRAFT_210641 [Hypoxylon sp. CI-4A]|nr:hypothetical protein M426DRAFT_210641 [Hypoxylon sp. CI-4A]